MHPIKTNNLTIQSKKVHHNPLNLCAADPFVVGKGYCVFFVGLIISVLIVDCYKIFPLRLFQFYLNWVGSSCTETIILANFY